MAADAAWGTSGEICALCTVPTFLTISFRLSRSRIFCFPTEKSLSGRQNSITKKHVIDEFRHDQIDGSRRRNWQEAISEN